MSSRLGRSAGLADVVAHIDAEVARRRADGSIPGLAIAVTDLDGTLIDRVYGHADVAGVRPVQRDTLFEIGSIGKTFTALVVMQLAEEERLSLDDPVVRHLPWFRVPRTGSRITIRHLLGHTAGITAGHRRHARSRPSRSGASGTCGRGRDRVGATTTRMSGTRPSGSSSRRSRANRTRRSCDDGSWSRSG